MKARRPPPPMPALAKQPSTRPRASSVAAIAALTEAGSLTSQTRVSILPAAPARVAAAALFFSALRPQIETLQPLDTSACAMPSPIPPLPPVMTATRPVRSKMLIWVFPFDLAHSRCAPDAGWFWAQAWTRPPQKSNMGPENPDRPAVRKTRINARGNNAVQARHARFRRTGRGPQARSSGGHERGLHGHAGGTGRSAR